ncbi:zinc finger, CCHC-type containing protein, partial [Tanacetum coccineum]
VALFESKIPLYKDMLLFLSNGFISKALTIQPSVIYTKYLRELWYTAEVVDDAITFSLSNVEKPLSFNRDIFSSVIGLDYTKDFVSLPLHEALTSGGKKGKEKNACCIRYLSLVMEHLLGEDYLYDDLKSKNLIRSLMPPLKSPRYLRVQTPTTQAFESQQAEEPEHDDDEFVHSELHSIGDVALESFNDPADESPYDPESEIKFMKRFKPLIDDAEPLITSMAKEHSDMEEDSDLASIPDDEVGSPSGSQTSETEEDTQSEPVLSKSEERDANNVIDELAKLKASADKPSDPLGHLKAKITSLSTKVNQLETSITNKVSEEIQTSVPSLITEALKQQTNAEREKWEKENHKKQKEVNVLGEQQEKPKQSKKDDVQGEQQSDSKPEDAAENQESAAKKINTYGTLVIHASGENASDNETDVIFNENKFSSVSRPSQRSLVNRTEDSGGSVVPEKATDESRIDYFDYSSVGCEEYFFEVLEEKSRIDYFDYLVAHINIIRLLIAMASIHNLIIHQLDVKTTFLNGDMDEEAPKQWHQKFDKVVLSNGYLLNQADKMWPDIAFAVGKLSRYTGNPGTQHWQAIERVFVLSGGAISWASKKQTCITRSTMEYEFMALAAAGKEAEWLRNLIFEILLWSKPIAPISIRCDSVVTFQRLIARCTMGSLDT